MALTLRRAGLDNAATQPGGAALSLDPALFRPEAIDEESRQLIDQLKTMAAAGPAMHTLSPVEARNLRAGTGRGPGGLPIVYSEHAVIRTIPGPAGEITLRTFVPPRVEGAYLYIHGGGWVLGTADSNDVRLETLSNDLNLAVLSVEYRLAPEHPYPAGPDDCEAAALWLAKNVQSEYGASKLLIGGDSAGAHLAVVSLLRLRDKHGVTSYRGANLGYGVFDVASTPSTLAWGDDPVILSTAVMRWFGNHFAPPERQREPDVSPLYADLHGLPKALFTVGTMDPLLDDSTFMHARWLAAGNDAELAVYPGGVHGLTGFPTALGRKAVARQDAFLKEALRD
jgi:acetyl esterase/lipase